MTKKIQWVLCNKEADKDTRAEEKAEVIVPEASAAAQFGLAAAEKARRFHQSFPGYAPTPLAKLSALAESLGVAGIYVKDESRRFGLNAFKGLGGSYCLGCYIAERMGLDIDELPFEKMTSRM